MWIIQSYVHYLGPVRVSRITENADVGLHVNSVDKRDNGKLNRKGTTFLDV